MAEATTAPPAATSAVRHAAAGLGSLFVWLLMGDFALYLMEAIIPNVLPLQLRSLQASSTLIALLMTGVPCAVSLLWTPAICTWSDRHRGKSGRRIPFIRAGTPLIVLVLAGLAYSDAIGASLHSTLARWLTPTGSVLMLIGILVLMFNMANALVYQMYFALFNDVVPREWMARFAVMFRIVGAAAGAVFNFWVFPYAESHRRELFLAVAGVYAVAYGLMSITVKEGSYPPPPEPAPGQSILSRIRAYLRECFFHRVYRQLFLTAGLATVGECMLPFYLLLSRSLGLDLAQIGWIAGSATLLSIPVYLLTAFFIDRVNILRLYLWVKLGHACANFAFAIFLFGDFSPRQVLILVIALNLSMLAFRAVFLVAGVPMNMILLPRQAYAQFTSALHVTNGVCGIIGAPLAGLFMDLMLKAGEHAGMGASYGYRCAGLWAGSFALLSTWCHFNVYRHVREHHGEDLRSYTPPTLSDASA